MAAVQAQLALNELLRGCPAHEALPGNTVILANRALEIIEGQLTPAHGAVWATIERKPGLLVCGSERARMQAQEACQDLSLDELLAANRMAPQRGENEE